MSTIRIATFNIENFFDRAKVMWLDWDKGRKKLELVAELQSELRQPVFDKKKITALQKQLKGYAEIQEVRGKWKSTKGRDGFLGWVELTREPVRNDAQLNTARTIAELDADILCLCEVESRPVLERFHNQVLMQMFKQRIQPYGYIFLIDGNDDRGIDVAIMSRHKIEDVKTHIWDRTRDDGGQLIFSRDCLELKIALDSGPKLAVLINHFKSKGYGRPADNDAKRKAQAERVKEILASGYNPGNDLAVVAGDLNDTPDSDPLSPLMGLQGLYNVVERLPADERWTHRYRNEGSQIDYLLVSDPLKNALGEVRIERRGMFGVPPNTPGYVKSFTEVKNEASSASDHAPIVAEFSV